MLAAIGAVAPYRLSGEADRVGADGWGTYVTVLLLVMAVPVALALAFGRGTVGQGWAVAAIVLFAVVALAAGWAGLYLGYAAALVLGLAIAAGDPLPPPAEGDDRFTRPMPNRPTDLG